MVIAPFTSETKYYFSEHAKQRMRERDVNQSWVENALKYPKFIRQTTFDNNKYEYIGVLATVVVAFDKDYPTLATVYRGWVNNPRYKEVSNGKTRNGKGLKR